MKVTVLGATGGIGGAVARELVDRGHDVRAVNRGGDADVPGATPGAADVTDATATKAVCADADVVVMAAQPPYSGWLEHFPELVETVIAAAGDAGARLVFVDNLYMYAPAEGALTEDSPEHARDPKGRLRRRLGERLLAAHGDGRVSVTIGRFSDYYGPRGTNSGLSVLGIEPAVAGRRPRALVALDQPHTFHYLPDAARGFATLVEDPRADGHVWLLPAAPPIAQRDMLDLVKRPAGNDRRTGVVSRPMLRLAGIFDPMIRETRSTTVQFDRPWIVDASRFQSTLGPIETTPHEAAIAETVAWFRDRRQQ